jgi:hypothetical protein
LEQLERRQAGRFDAARSMARRPPGGRKRQMFRGRRLSFPERLALEYRGSLQAAALNNLAVLRLLNGNYDGAEAPERGVSISPKTDIVYGRA